MESNYYFRTIRRNISLEERLIGKLYNFWKLIKITPEKWQEKKFGEEGGGFWVVAICGRRVIWFNDIEGGSIFQNIMRTELLRITGVINQNYMSRFKGYTA